MATIRNNGSKNNGKKKTVTEDIMDVLRPEHMISNAQKVLSSAVNILEEEIAAGIVAAKRIEKKVIDVESIRNNQEDLVNRIRHDMHEAVDIFLDALVAISRQLSALTNIIPKAEKTSGKDIEINKVIPVVENDKLAKRGEVVELYLSLSNDNKQSKVNIAFSKPDLLAGPDQKIIATNIQLKPAVLDVAPGESRRLTIQIKIPANCKPGIYSALMTDNNDTTNRVVLSLRVG